MGVSRTGGGWPTPQSSTAFHEPSACWRQTLMYSPCASGFFCVESLLQVQGPVLQPSLPSALIAACIGVHASRPFQPGFAFSYVFTPLTGPGRNTTLVGASHARKPSRTPWARTWVANARSAATIGSAVVASADVDRGADSTTAGSEHIRSSRRLRGTAPPFHQGARPQVLADNSRPDEANRSRHGVSATSAGLPVQNVSGKPRPE